MVERLFIAYFENAEDIGDIRALADIADMCGMDGVEVAQMLKSDTDLQAWWRGRTRSRARWASPAFPP